jgi:energy-coupling factor transport system ATP-binding protein
VVALEPKLLLLDEPTANLDPEGATLVRQAVQRVLNSTGATLILVEHRVTEALPLVDRVVVLEPGGGVLADGPPAEVFDRHRPELVAAGVWVPGYRVDPVRSQVPEPGRARLLTGSELNFEIGKQPVLAGVSVHASAGELVALTGPNGAGKSTLARILGGLLKPAQGSLVPTPLLAGMDSRPPWRWRSGELASRIGTVFQDPEHQFLTGRVRDELLLGPSRSGKLSPRQSGAPGSRRPGKLSPRQSGAPGSRRPGSLASAAGEKADELLALLRLEHLAEANPFTLSGGEQRRLSVATALASSPGLLILDEPTFGQDLRTWTELLRLLARARTDGAGLIVVTHDEAFVAAIADRTLTLAAGRLRDPARETANEPRENSAIPGNFSAPRENTPHENTPRENMGSPGNFIPPHENTPRENMGSPGNSTELTEGKK